MIIAAWLITISFIIDNYWSGNSSVGAVKENLQQYVQKQEKDFEKLLADTSLLARMSDGKYDETFLQQFVDKKYYIYRYFVNDIGQSQLVFWNTQAVIPPNELIAAHGTVGFAKLDNGYYVWRKLHSPAALTIALIPVKWNYFVTNAYLRNNFTTGNEIERNYDISSQPTKAVVKSMHGDALFYLAESSGSVIAKNNMIAVWLRILAGILGLLFIHLLANCIVANRNLARAISVLVIVVFFFRLISYFIPFPLNLRQFELFDPAVYGSNFISRSLGDLLINSILFAWVILFAHYHLQDKKITFSNKKPGFKWMVLAVSCLIMLAATFVAGDVIRSLVADSQISFDVINFFTLNIYSVTGFVVLCFVAMGYFLLSQVLLYFIRPFFDERSPVLYLATAIGGLIYLSFQLGNEGAGFKLFMLVWLLIYLLILYRGNLGISSKKIGSLRLIFWLFFFSITITGIIVQENSKKELSNRKHYAEILSTKADPSSETLLNTLLTDFRSDYLAANFYRLTSDSSNRYFKDSLVNGNFSGYTNKYDTRVYTFDVNENPLFNDDASTFNELNTVFKTQAKPTNIPDLFYYDESYDRFSYISRRIITDFDGDTLGYAFVLANPKKYKTDALNLELFSKGSSNAIENSSVYAFAVYNNLQLVSSHNDYAFATKLTAKQVPKEDFVLVKKEGYDELWYRAGAQKVVIIAKENNFLIESITLFSYLFCSFLLVTGLFSLFIITFFFN